MTDVVTYDVVPRAGVIDLGKQVEGLVTRVVLPNIRRGAGAVQLVHQRSDDQKPYLVPVTEDGDKVYWIVSRSDTAFPGRGQAELQWLGENGEVAKSVTYQTNTTRSMAEPGSEPDEPLKPYTQAVARDAQAAKDAAASATEAARSAAASAGQAGLSAATATEAARNAEAIVGQAGQSAQSAQAAALAASQNAAAAETAEDGAKQAQTGAEAASTKAQTAKTAAEKAAQEAKTAQAGAVEAKTGAETAQAKAEEAAQEAQKAAETAVLYTEQNLTDSQQEQARSNINAADKARQNVLVGTETGNPIAVDDAFSAPLCGLTVYGKSNQDGTPSSDNPATIVNAGNGGTVDVALKDKNGEAQSITIRTPGGIAGVPAISAEYGTNYTDQNGKFYVCDEIDFSRGMMVKRIETIDLDVDENIVSSNYEIGKTRRLTYRMKLPALDRRVGCICNRCIYRADFPGDYEHIYADRTNIFLFIPASAALPRAGEYIVAYALATPKETPLSAVEIAAYKALATHTPAAVVQASDGVGIKLEYQRDVNIAIKKLEDAIASIP